MKVFQKFIHITAAAFCLLIVPNILSAKFTKDGIQRITREEIRKACLMRLNELFNLIDDWQGFSVDGFDWRMSVNSLRPVQTQGWIILLNGQRVSIQAFKSQNINLLPVSIEQIDSVTVVGIPQLYGGEFSDRGIIHIYTTEEDTGLALHGRLALGNETGDPGPYRYTPQSTVNVDREANDESYGMSYAADNWQAGAHQKNLVHYPTDERILKRVWFPLLKDDYPRIDVNSTFLQGRYKKQYLQVGYTFNRDHLFVKPLSREIPMRRSIVFGGLRGIVSKRMHYALLYQNDLISKRENYNAGDINRKSQFLNAQIGGIFGSTRAGMEFQNYLFSSPYVPGQKERAQVRFSIANTISIGRRIKQMASSQVLACKDFTTVKAALSYHYFLRSFYTINGTLAYSERHPEEYDEYDGLSPGSGLKSSFNGNRKERSGSVNVYNYIKIRPDLQAMVGLKLIKYFSTILEDQLFYYTNYNFSFTSPLKFNTGAGGESAGIFIHVKHKWHRNLAQEIFYQCRFYQKGDDLYLDGLSPLPRQKASLQVSFMPFENSSVWTKITWIPETRWPEYKNIAEQSNYLYNDVVPEAINWDLALQKTIWKKRLRGSLVFRNLLNRRQISHPVGTSNLLRFYIQVELDLHPYRPDYLKN